MMSYKLRVTRVANAEVMKTPIIIEHESYELHELYCYISIRWIRVIRVRQDVTDVFIPFSRPSCSLRRHTTG